MLEGEELNCCLVPRMMTAEPGGVALEEGGLDRCLVPWMMTAELGGVALEEGELDHCLALRTTVADTEEFADELEVVELDCCLRR